MQKKQKKKIELIQQKAVKKVASLTRKIVLALNLEKFKKEDNLSFVQRSQFYFQVFCQLFPHSELLAERQHINYFMLEDVDQIQYLLDYLADEVLQMELDHIQAKQISGGNPFHIQKILEILVAIVQNMKNQQEEVENKQLKNFDEILKNSKDNSGERIINKPLEPIQDQLYIETQKTKNKSKSKSKKSNKKFQKSIKEKTITEKEIVTEKTQKKSKSKSKQKKKPRIRNKTSHFFKKTIPEIIFEKLPSVPKKIHKKNKSKVSLASNPKVKFSSWNEAMRKIFPKTHSYKNTISNISNTDVLHFLFQKQTKQSQDKDKRKQNHSLNFNLQLSNEYPKMLQKSNKQQSYQLQKSFLKFLYDKNNNIFGNKLSKKLTIKDFHQYHLKKNYQKNFTKKAYFNKSFCLTIELA